MSTHAPAAGAINPHAPFEAPEPAALSVGTPSIAVDAVTEPKIGPEAVDTDSLKALATTAGKLAAPGALPAKGAAGTVTVQEEATPARKIVAVAVGKAAQTVFNVVHGLASKAVIVEVYEGEAEPEQTLTGFKVKAKTVNEIVVTFSVAPAEGTYILITVMA
jgi:hypothetical protein